MTLCQYHNRDGMSHPFVDYTKDDFDPQCNVCSKIVEGHTNLDISELDIYPDDEFQEIKKGQMKYEADLQSA